jgi:ATP-dependent RNA helicase DDX41
MKETFFFKITFIYSWRPPRAILQMSEERHQRIRSKYNINVEGDDIPPPLCRFEVCLISLILINNL